MSIFITIPLGRNLITRATFTALLPMAAASVMQTASIAGLVRGFVTRCQSE
ncbi:MAG: hypothetical protein ABI870_02575 [Rhodanobacter sp.]